MRTHPIRIGSVWKSSVRAPDWFMAHCTLDSTCLRSKYGWFHLANVIKPMAAVRCGVFTTSLHQYSLRFNLACQYSQRKTQLTIGKFRTFSTLIAMKHVDRTFDHNRIAILARRGCISFIHTTVIRFLSQPVTVSEFDSRFLVRLPVCLQHPVEIVSIIWQAPPCYPHVPFGCIYRKSSSIAMMQWIIPNPLLICRQTSWSIWSCLLPQSAHRRFINRVAGKEDNSKFSKDLSISAIGQVFVETNLAWFAPRLHSVCQ